MRQYKTKEKPWCCECEDGIKLWYFGNDKDAKKWFKKIAQNDHSIKMKSMYIDRNFVMTEYTQEEINSHEL